jgi:hypothetical protein
VKRYVFIGVEGNHDQAFVSKVLCSLLGYSKFNGKESDLDSFWRKLVPKYHIDPADFSTFAIIADADKKTPQQVARSYHNKLIEIFPNFPDNVTNCGSIMYGQPTLGLYILPDNSHQGVLDTLICECGNIAYPEYMERAKNYINLFSEEDRKNKGLKWKPFAREKALIATVTSVLKPGKTNQASISDNNWISLQTEQAVPELQNLKKFLRDLLNQTLV